MKIKIVIRKTKGRSRIILSRKETLERTQSVSKAMQGALQISHALIPRTNGRDWQSLQLEGLGLVWQESYHIGHDGCLK